VGELRGITLILPRKAMTITNSNKQSFNEKHEWIISAEQYLRATSTWIA